MNELAGLGELSGQLARFSESTPDMAEAARFAEEVLAVWLGCMVSGEWPGTMNLSGQTGRAVDQLAASQRPALVAATKLADPDADRTFLDSKLASACFHADLVRLMAHDWENDDEQ